MKSRSSWEKKGGSRFKLEKMVKIQNALKSKIFEFCQQYELGSNLRPFYTFLEAFRAFFEHLNVLFFFFCKVIRKESLLCVSVLFFVLGRKNIFLTISQFLLPFPMANLTILGVFLLNSTKHYSISEKLFVQKKLRKFLKTCKKVYIYISGCFPIHIVDRTQKLLILEHFESPPFFPRMTDFSFPKNICSEYV